MSDPEIEYLLKSFALEKRVINRETSRVEEIVEKEMDESFSQYQGFLNFNEIEEIKTEHRKNLISLKLEDYRKKYSKLEGAQVILSLVG